MLLVTPSDGPEEKAAALESEKLAAGFFANIWAVLNKGDNDGSQLKLRVRET